MPLLRREFGKAKSMTKADGSRVTAVDIAISEDIFRDLQARFPDDQYFSEELAGVSGPIPVTARFSWLLDPIDGTNNFILGIPHCAIGLALLEDGMPVHGCVYDLSRDVMLHGGPLFGLWENDSRMDRGVTGSHETLIGFHRPNDPERLPGASAILSRYKIRGLGSATLHLAYVATGLLDGSVDFNLKVWDLASAVPLCAAAGVEVRFLNGEQFPMRTFDLSMERIVYVAGRPEVASQLAALIES